MNEDVVGVVTAEPDPFFTDYGDLKTPALAHGVDCLVTADVSSDPARSWILEKKADVIFCIGWNRLVPGNLLRSAPMGAIGFHPAALPRNRGRHPLIWALVLGLKQTASTFFQMDENADAGDILSQVIIEIDATDDAGSLYQKMTRVGLSQFKSLVGLLKRGQVPRTPQDPDRASHWRRRGPTDGRIDFRMSAEAICNLVRALAKPYPGAHVDYGGRQYKVWKASQSSWPQEDIEPGRMLGQDTEGVLVKCGLRDEAVLLVEHEFEQFRKGDYFR